MCIFSNFRENQYREFFVNTLSTPSRELGVDVYTKFFLNLQNVLKSKAIRDARQLKFEVPTKTLVQNPISLNVMVLINSAESDKGKSPILVKAEQPACGSNGDPNAREQISSHKAPKHFQAPKRARLVDPTALAPSPCENVLDCPVSNDAFRVASLFRGGSTTFRFCDNAAYDRPEVANFIAQSIRNRARSIKTLKRISEFAELFYTFSLAQVPPFPYFGDESLIGITLWLMPLRVRGTTIPDFAKYPLRVFAEALGVVLPLNHPAVKEAAPTRGAVK